MHKPLLTALEHTGRWLTQRELARICPDFNCEEHLTTALQNHIRAGDIVPRLRDAEKLLYEYGQPAWLLDPPPEPQTELDRIQRITRAWWAAQPA